MCSAFLWWVMCERFVVEFTKQSLFCQKRFLKFLSSSEQTKKGLPKLSHYLMTFIYCFEANLWISTWDMAQVRVSGYWWTWSMNEAELLLFHCSVQVWPRQQNIVCFRAVFSVSTGFVILYSGWRLPTKARGQVHLLLKLNLPLCRLL